MKSFSFKRTILNGITLALPLAVVFYVLIKIVAILEKTIAPLAKRAGISHILGEITLTVFAILCLLILIFLLGLLMHLSFIASFRTYLQDWILKLVPSLNYLKLIADEKLHTENTSNAWKSVLIEKDEQFTPGFIIEETDEWITLAYVKPPSAEPENMLITKKSSVRYKEITMKQMIRFNKQFGKGYLSLIQEAQRD